MTTKHCKYKRDELEKYCKDKHGYVKCVTQSMHIGLPPWGLTNIKETVRDTVLEEKFGHFDATLGGIVLDIRNITILGDNYPVHNDSSAVHVSLKVNFYVFQPHEGVIVKGIIKHIAFHHISVTIHRFFNVSIPMEKKNNNLKIDMEVNVRLTKLDFEDSIPYFEGELELPIGHELKENSTDSGICTNGTKVKLMKTTNGEISSDCDEDSSSDSDDVSSSDIDDIDFAKIKVKEEPKSSSESFSSNNSDSEHKSTSMGFDRKKSLTKVAIKRETSSSSSSTDAEDLTQNVKIVKLSLPPIQQGKRKRHSTRDEPIPKIKKEMSFSSSDEIESTKQLMKSNTQNGTTSPKKNIQDKSILLVEKVKRKKLSAGTPMTETNLSHGRSSTSLEKKHKKKSREQPHESSSEVSSTRPQTVSYIQDQPARNVKKEKSSSNDETNFAPGLSSTLLVKKKKSSREDPSVLSNEINSSWCQQVKNISDEQIVSVKRERSLSSSSDSKTNFSSNISSKREKKPSKATEYLKGLLRNKNKT